MKALRTLKHIILISIVTLSVCADSFGQEEQNVKQPPSIDELFEFGQRGLYDFIKRCLHMPEFVKKNNLSCRSLIKVVVSSEGEIDSLKIYESAGYDADDEALQIMSMTEGLWNPVKDGPHVFVMPIRFKANNAKAKSNLDSLEKSFKVYNSSKDYPYKKQSYIAERRAESRAVIKEMRGGESEGVQIGPHTFTIREKESSEPLPEVDIRKKTLKKMTNNELFGNGVDYFDLGMFEESSAFFEAFLKRAPENGLAKLRLGYCYLMLNRKDDACDAWRSLNSDIARNFMKDAGCE